MASGGNNTHTFSIQSNEGGLQTSNGATPGFSNHVDYSASVLWGGSNSSLQTSGAAGQSSPIAVVPGGVRRNAATASHGGDRRRERVPLLAGTYSDNITITFKPQM